MIRINHKYQAISIWIILLVVLFSCSENKKPPVKTQGGANLLFPQTALEKEDLAFVPIEGDTSIYGPTAITRNILQDRNGIIWFATWNGIISYNGELFTNHTNKENLRQYHVFSLLEDQKGNLWFGTIGAGIYKYDGNTFTNFTIDDGLVGNEVGEIYEDKTGNIWFGTSKGISIYNGQSFKNYTKEDGLLDNDINTIIEDQNGLFWIGTRGITYTFDGNSFSKIQSPNSSDFVNTRDIIEDRNGNLWFGGGSGLWIYKDQSFEQYAANFVGYLYEDSKGQIWTSYAKTTRYWVLSKYDEQVPFANNKTPEEIDLGEQMLFGILEDHNENIWFGHLEGIGRYNGTSFDYFKAPNQLPKS